MGARTSTTIAAWLSCCAFVLGCSRPGPPPHIILITADALRADHLSVNGYPRPTSPHIDRFIGEAWHFTGAVTVIPKTGPSFVTMFSGHHPQTHGVRHNFARVPTDVSLLAERLRGAGYRTTAFVANPALRPKMGYARGFDVYNYLPGEGTDRDVNAAFFTWARAAFERPTFAWVHYLDPHGPYEPPQELLTPFLDDSVYRADTRRVPLDGEVRDGGNRNKVLGAVPFYQRLGDEDRAAVYVARYDAEIRAMDDRFGELVGFLKERGLYEQSAVLFTADHGESLGEHDFYFEHGWFAYDSTLRVPFAIKPPAATGGRVVTEQVSNLDFLPSVLAVAGITNDLESGGRDLLAGVADPPPVLVESSDRYSDKYFGIRTERWKYLRRDRDGHEELYDLAADPNETASLVEREREVLESMRARLAAARSGGSVDAVLTDEDEATLERLESLGYVDRSER